MEGLEIGEAGVTLDRIVIDGSRPGVATGTDTVEVENDSAFQAVVDAFEAKDVEGDTLEAEGEEAAADSAQAAERDQETDERATHPPPFPIWRSGTSTASTSGSWPRADQTVTLRPEEPWETRADGAVRAGGDASFTLPGLYSVGGLYRDTNRDLVPDETLPSSR